MLVKLYRDSFETPWGFRLQGGKDLNQPLVLQRVFSNSPAEGELQRGDIILSINGRDAGSFTHKQAQDSIKFAGGQIELDIQRPAPGRVHIQPLQPTSPTRAPSTQFFNRRASDTTHSKMPPPPVAGHMPKKVTLNKFGGGTTSFGQSFKSNKSSTTTWQPVSPPQSSTSMMNRVQDSLDSALSPTSPPQGYYQQPFQQQRQPPPQQQRQSQPQQQYRPPQQQYQPPPQQYQPPPQQYQPPPQQYQPPPQQYQQQQYTPTYQSIGDLQPDYVRADDPVLEEEYEYTPVKDRKKQFVEQPHHAPQVKRGKKKFVPPVAAGYQSFGVDYSKTQRHEPEEPRFPKPPPPQQPPVNRAPQYEPEVNEPKPWSGTLKAEGRALKPWELEDQEYIMPSQLEAMRQQQQQQRPSRPQQKQQRQGPAVSPKPKPAAQIQVSPPKTTPVRQISVRTSSTVSNPSQQQQQGDRDWNQSYVYKMVKEETKRETQMYPGQAPVTTQTYSSKTYQSGQPPLNESYGISDF